MSNAQLGVAGGAEAGVTPAALASPAYPQLVRTLAVILVLDLIGFGLWSIPALRSTDWSAGSLAVFASAIVCIAWIGYWILNSQTRLDGDVLTQTWLWTKRENAADVAQLKLVHWRRLERLIAPRLLVRRRNGAITWVHSANADLLTGFAERVAKHAASRTGG